MKYIARILRYWANRLDPRDGTMGLLSVSHCPCGNDQCGYKAIQVESPAGTLTVPLNPEQCRLTAAALTVSEEYFAAEFGE